MEPSVSLTLTSCEPTQKRQATAIQQLEAALAALPEDGGHEATREILQEQIVQKKKALGEARPIGKRLDSAQAALERARSRHNSAQESVRLAHEAADAAAAEVVRLEAEVTSLQQQVTQEKTPPAVQELGRLLQETVQQLEAIGTISPDAIVEAKAQSDEIFTRFKATLDNAARAAAAPTRVTSKTAPPEPVPMQEAPVDHRLRGKQAQKKYITDHLVKKPCDKRRSFSVPPEAGSANL